VAPSQYQAILSSVSLSQTARQQQQTRTRHKQSPNSFYVKEGKMKGHNTFPVCAQIAFCISRARATEVKESGLLRLLLAAINRGEGVGRLQIEQQ